MPGLLRIRGKIELDQFWPSGTSDADTSKVLVTVGKSSFAFAADGKKFKTTRVLETAKVVGTRSGPIIDTQSRVTVRLQGIDAPELHFKAAPLRNPKGGPPIATARRDAYNAANRAELRQHWGETATVAMARKLGALGAGTISCEVFSFVDHPYELVDTYGRIVGNVRVGARYRTDVNLWLAAEGWAFPSFYSSMSEAEIGAVVEAAAKGRKKGRVWSAYTNKLSMFDPGLAYRKGGPVDAASDPGPLVLPKLFRRQVAHNRLVQAKLFKGTMADYLEAKPEQCYLTTEFLAQSVHTAQARNIHDFVKANRFTLAPEDIVFKEKFSTVNGADGKRLDRF